MSVLAGLLLALIVAGIVVAAARFLSRRKDDGDASELDLIAYLLLAIAVGTTVFGLARLGRAAFPGENVVVTGGEQVPIALAAIVVGAPFAVLLWRRQAERRQIHPGSAGWPLYLAVAEAVLTTSLVVVTFQLLDWLLDDGRRSSWTDVLIVGGAVVFHEWAARKDPPGSDIAGLPRVVGSAIGLVTTSIGLGGLAFWVFDYLYSTFVATAGGGDVLEPVLILVIGAPLWAYKWLRPWPSPPALPRKTWLVVTSTVGALAAIASVVVMVVSVVTYVLGDVDSAADHFAVIPGALSAFVVAGLVWWHHRRRLSPWRAVTVGESMGAGVPLRDNSLRSYEYIMAAIGLSVAVGGLTGLSAVAFGEEGFAGDRGAALTSLVVVALAAMAVWAWFWSRGQRADRPSEAVALPRRIYVLGMAIVAGLAGAQALIATLVVLFQSLFGQDPSQTTLATEGSLTVFATGVTLHLLAVNRDDRALSASAEVITPFAVTVICSHPGPLATTFPKEAKLRVIYRADGIGVIDDALAQAIVAAVGHHDALVWVNSDGFDIAPAK